MPAEIREHKSLTYSLRMTKNERPGSDTKQSEPMSRLEQPYHGCAVISTSSWSIERLPFTQGKGLGANLQKFRKPGFYQILPLSLQIEDSPNGKATKNAPRI